MNSYLNKDFFNIKQSCIISAPTGIGKTTALLEYLKENNKQAIIVSPLNSLGNQISEKFDFLSSINCDVSTNIIGDITYSLSLGKTIIISLQTFIKYAKMFYNFDIYVDECHKLIEFSEMINIETLIEDIKNNKFKKFIGITATPLGLDWLLGLDIISSNIKPKYIRNITLSKLESYQLENLLSAIIEIHKEHGKLLVMYNNKNECMRLTEELKARKYNVFNYNSEVKEVFIENERFTKDFDILFCTSSLTTGVSIIDEYYSVCILRHFDTINAIPQFFARNRNEISNGMILRTSYSNNIQTINFSPSKFLGATSANENVSLFIKNYLIKLKLLLNKEFLEFWLQDEGTYNISYGKQYSKIESLQINSKYMDKIDDQKEYFCTTLVPRFNKANYKNLELMYKIYDGVENNNELNDDILNGYIKEYVYFNHHDDDYMNRKDFYEYFYSKIKDYHKEKANNMSSQVSSDSLDVADFEIKFNNKKYVKKELKKYCIENFNLKNEIFKNKESIDIFLNNIGFRILHKRTGDYIVKIDEIN